MPASFTNHNDFYVLNGAHAAIANDCASCHNGDYNNTPNTCIGCHQADYNATTNPNHQSSGFGTDCTTCHTEMPGYRRLLTTITNISRFTVERTMENGINVWIAIQNQPTMFVSCTNCPYQSGNR
ncbi:MAG: hypothetical protein R2784_18700 [Saprospiraceae bacterium]